MTDIQSTSRRNALQTLGASVLAPVVLSACAQAPAIVGGPSALMAKGTRRRVVVLGGGRDADPVVRHRSDELFAAEVLPGLR